MSRTTNTAFAVVALIWAGFIAWLVALTPVKDGTRDWFGSLNPGGWMAWTFPTALFYAIIAGLLILFLWLALRFPEVDRKGILGIETTRGDRLFITLLGSAFICLAWLATFGAPLWGALIACLVYAVAVFRWV